MIQQKKITMNKNNDVRKENEADDSLYMVKECAGNVEFYKCRKCPYIALSIKDIKFHWQSLHIALESENKKKEVKGVTIKCPGCSGIFYSESGLMVHLRSHHKMSPKDIPKLAFGLTKEAEKNKEYIEKLDVVIGSFKCEDQISFDGNFIPSVIEVPPDPIQSTPNLQISTVNIEHETVRNEPQMLDTSSSRPKQYDLNINSIFGANDHNFVRQISHSESVVLQNIQNGSEACLLRGHQHLTSTTLDIDDTHGQKPHSTSNNIQPLDHHILTLLPKTKKGTLPKKTKKNKSKVIKKGRPFGAKSIGISNNKCSSSDEKEIIKQFGQRCCLQGCGVRLISNEKMSYHKSCHFNDTFELFCPECKKQCPSVESLHLHLWNQHNIDLELQSCDQCSYKTFKKSILNNIHKKIHSDEKTFACEVCSQAFKNSKQLSNHKLNHRDKGSTKYICDICKRELKSRRQLTKHTQAVHEKMSSFHCQQCEYSAATKHSLLLHQKSHTGEKPFVCEQCSFRTSLRSSLRRHLQVHSQDKKYSCEHCSYSCIQASSLKIHVTSKHPGLDCNLIHLCSFCSYKSVNKANFAVHMCSHTGGDLSRKPELYSCIEGDRNGKNKSPSLISASAKKFDMEIFNPISKENNTEIIYSNTEELTSDIDKSGVHNVNKLDLSKDASSFNFDKYVSTNLIRQEVTHGVADGSNDLYYHLPQESNDLDVVTKNNTIFVKDILDLAAKNITKSSLTQNFLQNSPTANIQTFNIKKKATLPIILVNPKTQICSETDKRNSPKMLNYTAHQIRSPQLLHLPLQNEPSINDGLPRKKPKISVKSNLILKGPDNLDGFNIQKCKSLEDEFTLQNLPFSIEHQNTEMPYDVTASADSQQDNIMPVSKLIARDPFMSEANYLLTSNFFSNLQVPNISNSTLLIQPSSVISINKSQSGMRNNVSMTIETNQISDMSDIKLENKPFIPLQSESSCTSLHDNVSGSGSLIYEVPKHTIPIKFESKSDMLGSYAYQEGLFQNVNGLTQMQNVSIIEELPASFEHSNGIIDAQNSQPYGDNSYSPCGNFDVLDENEIIIVDDTSCEMKSIPNFGDESNFSLAEKEPFYNYNIQNMQLPLIHNIGQSTNNTRKHIKEKPRIISEVHISSDKSKIMNFAAVKNLGLKLEFPSIQNIEWTLALLNDHEKS